MSLRELIRGVSFSVMVVTSLSCAPSGDLPAPWSDPALHIDAFAEVNGVRLNYLDWGGTGEPVILIHGAWSNPHVWDAVAPLLATEYRVIAYARRGLGKSEVPGEEFDLDDLVEDLRVLMDEFEIERGHLVGWSFAGYEMTRFAALHPNRTGRLVFVDAHFEFAAEEPVVPFRLSAFDDEWPDLGPHPDDLRDIDSYRAWFHSTIVPDLEWTVALEAWVRDLVEPTPDGRLQERRAPVVAASLDRISLGYRREYDLVRSPVLALFAERFLIGPQDPEVAEAAAEWNEKYSVPGQEIGKARFTAELPATQIISYPATSHDGLLHKDPVRVAGDILRFLGER